MESKTRVVITLEGGLVYNILADKEIELLIIDYDTEGLDKEFLTDIWGDEAYLTRSTAEVSPKYVDRLFKTFDPDKEKQDE